jgi:hypothetical protein
MLNFRNANCSISPGIEEAREALLQIASDDAKVIDPSRDDVDRQTLTMWDAATAQGPAITGFADAMPCDDTKSVQFS